MFKIPESQNFILELIDNIDSINSSYDLKEEKIASLACKKAIKANDKISEFEVKSLLKNLSECENPFTCPHGRPIIVEFTKNEKKKCLKGFNNMQTPLIIITGPTAVGKTDLSIDIAKNINADIISADSMQIYKYMDIGSAKIKKEEMKGIKHYLVDEVEPDYEFSYLNFKKEQKII